MTDGISTGGSGMMSSEQLAELQAKIDAMGVLSDGDEGAFGGTMPNIAEFKVGKLPSDGLTPTMALIRFDLPKVKDGEREVFPAEYAPEMEFVVLDKIIMREINRFEESSDGRKRSVNECFSVGAREHAVGMGLFATRSTGGAAFKACFGCKGTITNENGRERGSCSSATLVFVYLPKYNCVATMRVSNTAMYGPMGSEVGVERTLVGWGKGRRDTENGIASQIGAKQGKRGKYINWLFHTIRVRPHAWAGINSPLQGFYLGRELKVESDYDLLVSLGTLKGDLQTAVVEPEVARRLTRAVGSLGASDRTEVLHWFEQGSQQSPIIDTARLLALPAPEPEPMKVETVEIDFDALLADDDVIDVVATPVSGPASKLVAIVAEYPEAAPFIADIGSLNAELVEARLSLATVLDKLAKSGKGVEARALFAKSTLALPSASNLKTLAERIAHKHNVA